MNEDEIMMLIGRLTVGQAIRDAEIGRLRQTIEGYEQAARQRDVPVDESALSTVESSLNGAEPSEVPV